MFPQAGRAQAPVFVISTKDSSIKFYVKASVPLEGTSAGWDLRYPVREKLIQFLREKNSHSRPNVRAELNSLPTENIFPQQLAAARRDK